MIISMLCLNIIYHEFCLYFLYKQSNIHREFCLYFYTSNEYYICVYISSMFHMCRVLCMYQVVGVYIWYIELYAHVCGLEELTNADKKRQKKCQHKYDLWHLWERDRDICQRDSWTHSAFILTHIITTHWNISQWKKMALMATKDL